MKKKIVRVISLSVSLFCSIIAIANESASNLLSEKLPIVNVAVDLSMAEVESRSNMNIEWAVVGDKGDRSGAAFIVKPHQFIYKDEDLLFEIDKAGSHISMPTVISITEDKVDILSASVLGHYASIDEVITKSKQLLSLFRQQGFVFSYSNTEPAKEVKFYVVDSNFLAKPPKYLPSFDKMKEMFLTTNYFVKEVLVFQLEKNALSIELRVTNMRRKYPGYELSNEYVSSRIRNEKEKFTQADLEKEEVYSLKLAISNKM